MSDYSSIPETVVRVSEGQFDKAYDILSTNFKTEIFFGDIGVHGSNKDEITAFLKAGNVKGFQISE